MLKVTQMIGCHCGEKKPTVGNSGNENNPKPNQNRVGQYVLSALAGLGFFRESVHVMYHSNQ